MIQIFTGYASLSIVTKVQIYWAIQTRTRDNMRGSVNVSIDQLSAENVKNSPTNDKYGMENCKSTKRVRDL